MPSPRARLRAVGIIAMLATSATAYGSEADASEDPEVAGALRFRQEFGLRSDLAYVIEVGRDSRSATDWGIPLTAAENAEMDRRRELAANMDRLNEYAATIPGIASVYFDQQAGGQIVVALTGDPDKYRSELINRMPEGGSLRFRQVTRSLADLNRLQEAITVDRQLLAQSGTRVNAIIVDEVGNVVEVGVDVADDITVEALHDRYGADALRVFEGGAPSLTHTGCYSRSHCYGPPLRAGISVSPSGCSLAFVVNQSGVRRILTAGHNPCGSFTGSASHDGFTFGSIRTRSWFGGDTSETADAATIGNLTTTQDDNLLYRSATSTWSITSAQTGDNTGIPVCLSARMKDANRCGSLVRTNATICFPEGCLVQQREATYEMYIGDSGGAVFDGGAMAMGVQSSCIDRTGDGACSEGNTADNALDGHIRNVFAELGGSMSIYTGN